ncbi:MAG: hypothetical protein ACFHXK_17535 [bacterium]
MGLALVLGGAALWLAVDMAQVSMALDGVIYSAIAQLFAQGQGSFWHLPHFEAGVGGFFDHPPLGLWLLSFWAQWLGSDFWVERSFLLMLMLGFCSAVGVLWSAATSSPSEMRPAKTADVHHRYIWWVMLLLLSMPVVRFTLVNNPLESLLAVFSLWAVVFAWWGMQRPWLNLITGVLCCAAVLTKGPVGLFALAAPCIFAWQILGNLTKAMRHTLLAAVPGMLLAAGLFAFEPARLALLAYLDTQLIGTFSGLRVPENGRLYLLEQFAGNLGVAVVVMLLVSRGRLEVQLPKVSKAYLLLGLCAFIPLLVSPRQYKHYLLSCLPYFALFLALLARPVWPAVWPRMKVRWMTASIVLVLLLTGLRVGVSFGKNGKDDVELSDTAAIAAVMALQPQIELAFCEATLRRRAYFTRYTQVQTYHVPLDELSSLGLGALYVCREPPGSGFVSLRLLNEGLQVWQRTSI